MFSGRSARTVATLALVAVLVGLLGQPASAASSCTNVPGSTPGQTLTVGGQTVRVPVISQISVCTTDGVVSLVSASTTPANGCVTGCLQVSLQGAIDAGAVSVSYQADGVPTTQTIDPPGVGDPNSTTCLLGVGSPSAPNTNCTIVYSIDNLPPVQQVVDDLVQTVQDLAGDLDDAACNSIPDSPTDEWGNGGTHFCDDPVQWAKDMRWQAEDLICAGSCQAQEIVDAIEQIFADLLADILGGINCDPNLCAIISPVYVAVCSRTDIC